jgi:osmotically-inducible protein OsmY
MNIRTRAFLLVVALVFPILAGCAGLDQSLNRPLDDDDAAVQRNVMERLEQENILPGSFSVRVSGGVATVYGRVPGEQARARALSVVRGTPGVSQVEDRLRTH